MFEKRYKKGEDAYEIINANKDDAEPGNATFICVLDGVGGWVRKLEDVGKMSKEMVGHIAQIYREEYTGNSLMDG